MTRCPLLLGAVALMALPATSLAHDATVACDVASPNGYRVTADWQHLDPVPTFTDTTVTVTWADRYRVTLPLPAGCVAPPPPVVPPAPPAPEQPVDRFTPPAAEPSTNSPTPQGTTPGGPVEPMGRKRTSPKPLIATKTVRTLRSIACTRAGQRSASIVRIRVVWSRGGVVVKTKQRTFRKAGVVCRVPVVAG